MKKITDLFKKIKNQESEKNFSALDLKLANAIANKGITEEEKVANNKLSEKIISKSSNSNRNSSIAKKISLWKNKKFKFAFASFASVSTLALSVFVLGFFGIIRFPWEKDVDTIIDLKNAPSAPLMKVEPAVYTESGYIAEDNSFNLNVEGSFKKAPSKVIKIYPEADVEFTVEKQADGMQNILITPKEELEEGKEYQIVIPQGTEFSNGAVLSKDLVWKYVVNPKFAVLGSTPRNGLTEVPYDTSIEIELNKKDVDLESLKNNVKIYPVVEFEPEIFGTKVILKLKKALLINETYTVVLTKDIKTKNGENLKSDYRLSFTTSNLDRSGKVLISKENFGFASYSYMPIQSIDVGISEFVYYSGFTTGSKIKADIYTADIDKVIDAMIYTSGRLKQLPEGATLVNSKEYELDNNYYSKFEVAYKPEKQGIYILHLKNDKTSKEYFTVYSFGPLAGIVKDLNGNVEGWVWNMDEEKVISNATITAWDTEKTDFKTKEPDCTGKADKNGKFKIGLCDLLKIQTDAGSMILSKKANNEYYSTNLIHTEIIFDKDNYAQGDSIDYAVYIKNLKDEVNSSSLKGKTVVVKIIDSTANKEVAKKEYVIDNEFGLVSGKFPALNVNNSDSFRFDVEMDNKIVGSKGVYFHKLVDAGYLYDLSIDKYYALENADVMLKFKGVDYSGMPLMNQNYTMYIYESEYNIERYYTQSYEEIASRYYGYYYRLDDEKLVESKKITLNSKGEYDEKYKIKESSTEAYFRIIAIQIRNEDDVVVTQKRFIVAKDVVNVRLREGNVTTYYVGDKPVIKLKADKTSNSETVGGYDFKARLYTNEYSYYTPEPYYDESTKSMIYPPTIKQYVGKKEVFAQDLETNDKGIVDWALPEVTEVDYYDLRIESKDGNKDYGSLFYVSGKKPDDSDNTYIEQLGIKINLLEQSENNQKKFEAIVKSPSFKNGIIIIYGEDVKMWEEFRIDGEWKKTFDMPSTKLDTLTVCAAMPGNYNDSYYNEEITYDNKEINIACSQIHVDNQDSIMDVDVKTNKDIYKPGDEAVITLKAKNRKGEGIKANFNMILLDKRIIDIGGLGFYYQCSQDGSDGNALYCVNEFYSAKIQYTNFAGSIKPKVFIDWSNYGGDEVFEGDGLQKYGAISKSDKNYVFMSNINTDENGNATIKFNMPQNLTTWKLFFKGVDDKDLEGFAQKELKTVSERYLEIIAPTILRVSDNVVTKVVFRNYKEAFSGKIGFECTGCEEEKWEKDVQLSANDVLILEAPITIKQNYSGKTVKLLPYISSGSTDLEKIDQSPVYIPVYSGNKTISETFSKPINTNSGENQEVVYNVNLGEVDEKYTSIDICFAPSFPISDFSEITSTELKSTNDLANSILLYLFMYKNYDNLDIKTMSKENLYNKITEFNQLLMENQAEGGGFGWFDYDAESLESSTYVAEIFGKMMRNGLTVDSSRRENLQNYFLLILDGEEYSLEQKIFALKGMSNIYPDTVAQYMPIVIEEFKKSELINSPLVISSLMQIYNNIGSTGNSQELVPYLKEVIKETDRSAYWEDVDGDYKVISSTDMVTSYVYLALQPLDFWDLKYKARNWLLERNIELVNSRLDYKRISYVLAEAEENRLESVNGAGILDLYVNGQYIEGIKIPKNIGKNSCLYTIYADKLTDNENEIKLSAPGRQSIGELFTVIKVVKQSDAEIKSSDDILKEFVDLNTKTRVNQEELKYGNYYVIKITAKNIKKADHVNLQDDLASNLQFVDEYNPSVPKEISDKYKAYLSTVSNRYYGGMYMLNNEKTSSGIGSRGQTEEVETYLVRAGFKGSTDGGKVSVIYNPFTEYNQFRKSDRVIVK